MEYISLTSSALFLVLLWIIYSYLKQSPKYWKDLGVTEVPASGFISTIYTLLTKPLNLMEVERLQKYGRLHGYYEGSTPALTVAEPALLRDVLVKDFQYFPSGRNFGNGVAIIEDMVFNTRGEKWKRIRSIITPAFSTGKIKKMFEIMSESASTLSKNLSTLVKRKESVDVKRFYSAFTMDAIATSVFGTKIDSHNDPDNQFVTVARKAFSEGTDWRFIVPFLFPRISKLLKIELFDPSVTAFFKDVTLQVIKERRENPSKRRNDFLQMMMDAEEDVRKGNAPKADDPEDETEDNIKDMSNDAGNDSIFKINSQMKGLSRNEMVANCVMFLFGGFETTAVTLANISYLMAIHPDIQEKLIEEVDDCIRQNKNALNYEAVQNMKYMDMIIAETLRLYTPVVSSERFADSDYKLGNTGIVVKKGMVVHIPVYAIHMDPKFYPEPEKFDPMRFSNEEKANRDSLAYLPFGAGPRNCLGMRFALVLIKICLASVVSQFRFKKCPRTKVPLEYSTGFGLYKPKEVILGLEERADKVV